MHTMPDFETAVDLLITRAILSSLEGVEPLAAARGKLLDDIARLIGNKAADDAAKKSREEIVKSWPMQEAQPNPGALTTRPATPEEYRKEQERNKGRQWDAEQFVWLDEMEGGDRQSMEKQLADMIKEKILERERMEYTGDKNWFEKFRPKDSKRR